jgi:hypothetical protein
VFEIDESARGPDALDKFLAGNSHTGIFDQGCQDAKWLIVNAEPSAVLPKFCLFDVQFEGAESDYSGGPPRHLEKRLPLERSSRLARESSFPFIS